MLKRSKVARGVLVKRKPAKAKVKIKVKGTPEQVVAAVKKLAGGRQNGHRPKSVVGAVNES